MKDVLLFARQSKKVYVKGWSIAQSISLAAHKYAGVCTGSSTAHRQKKIHHNVS
jgi:hypothetical protein